MKKALEMVVLKNNDRRGQDTIYTTKSRRRNIAHLAFGNVMYRDSSFS